jgi:hypothetical protein
MGGMQIFIGLCFIYIDINLIIIHNELRRLVEGFPSRRPGFDPRLCHMGFVVDKVAMGQVFSEYFGFPCQISFLRLFHTHHLLSSGAGKIGQTVADVPNGLSLTPPQEIKKLKGKLPFFPPSIYYNKL